MCSGGGLCSVMSSKGVRHTAMFVYTSAIHCLLTTVLLATVCWETKTSYCLYLYLRTFCTFIFLLFVHLLVTLFYYLLYLSVFVLIFYYYVYIYLLCLFLYFLNLQYLKISKINLSHIYLISFSITIHLIKNNYPNHL